jgi:hypothetical protein
VACKPKDWNFAAISHQWENNDPWTALQKRPYPAVGGVKVTDVRKESLLALAQLCLSLNMQFFSLDCLCINQDLRLEQAREILNRGKYYSEVANGRTLVPPGRLAFRLASRAWTL